MFESSYSRSIQLWKKFDPYVLKYNYRLLRNNIVKKYYQNNEIVRNYKEATENKVNVINPSNLSKKIYENILSNNVSLLKNSIELWETASTTSKAISPILYHYSWHCFMAYFNYSLFKWDPSHAPGHGIKLVNMDSIGKIKIDVYNKGVFQRCLDTWSLLGVPLIFSKYIPVAKNLKWNFVSNKDCVISSNGSISLKYLLNFNENKIDNIITIKDDERIKNISLSSRSRRSINKSIVSYLIVFVASCIARYRPRYWGEIILGHSRETSHFMTQYNQAIQNYTTGGDRGDGFLTQVLYFYQRLDELPEIQFIMNTKQQEMLTPNLEFK